MSAGINSSGGIVSSPSGGGSGSGMDSFLNSNEVSAVKSA